MSSTIRPVITEYDLGRRGFDALHETARRRRRHPRDQAIQWLQWAASQHLAGENTELTQAELVALFESPAASVA